MKKQVLFLLIMCALSVSAQVQNPAYIAYIQQWRMAALQQEKEYHIPAAITMAQGLLESGAGMSTLAREGNNHFGIKCAGGWTGETITHDDETRNECFRKYNDASESYEDHSKFLQKTRYQSLFLLDVTDYVGWANGLSKCGYATDPAYPSKLIRLIEDYNLAQLDNDSIFGRKEATTKEALRKEPAKTEAAKSSESKKETAKKTESKKEATKSSGSKKETAKKTEHKKETAKKAESKKEAAKKTEPKKETAKKTESKTADKPKTAAPVVEPEQEAEDVVAAGFSQDEKIEMGFGNVPLYAERSQQWQNGVPYVVAEYGDTFRALSIELGISESRLRKYNDVPLSYQPQSGDRIYLFTKKKKVANGPDIYRVKEGDSAWSIAQQFGIQLKSLYELNGIVRGTGVHYNQELKLR